MSLPAITCAALVVVAAALAVDRAMVDRAHWPLAAALVVYMLDPARPDGAAWLLALPAMGAAVAVIVLARARIAALAVAGLVLVVGGWELRRTGSRSAALLLASGVSIVAQAFAALAASRRRLALTDRCALVLLAGDVAALAGPLGDAASLEAQRARWWLAQWQGAAVAAVLCGMHLAALRARRG